MPAHTVYTLRIHLAESKNPIISRTIAIDANATFKQLHNAIQYAFGWQNSHLHIFTVNQRSSNSPQSRVFSPQVRLAEITSADFYDDGWDEIPKASFGEEKTRLKALWGSNSRSSLRSKAVDGQSVFPIVEYEYDFGVRIYSALASFSSSNSVTCYRTAGVTTSNS